MEKDLQNILNKFTHHFKKVLISAQNIAWFKKQKQIEAIDILTALVKTKGALGAEILLKKEIDKILLNPDKTENNFSEINLETNWDDLPQPSTTCQKIIERAILIAFKNQHRYIGTEHLLMSLTESDDQTLNKTWGLAKTNPKAIQQHLNLVLKTTSKFNEITISEDLKELDTLADDQANNILKNFTLDLTDENIQKDIDPVIGRNLEIERLIQILARRHKNNPLLLGEAGVGKTAIIEGLAKKILLGEVPDILLNKKILTLDLPGLLAGTMYRGEFESRLKQVINEAQNNKNVILFIDELHNIIGAGSTGGSMDAANILKPALARGSFRCIGATTFDEYKKFIENDKALERRFQVINVEEASLEEALQILQGIKKNYEQFHKITITDEALKLAVLLSKKYFPDKKLPDKAIDILDEAAAKYKIKHKQNPDLQVIRNLEVELKKIYQEKNQALLTENYTQALSYKNQEENLLLNLNKLKNSVAKKNQVIKGILSAKDIKDTVAKINNLKTIELDSAEEKNLLNLESKLSSQIFGQKNTFKQIANVIRKSKAGLQDTNRPLASFMFLGASGVGKTATAKLLAEILFGSSKNLIRIDMSEFSESFTISKLIGAPAGYVGYKEANKFSDLVKNKPHSLILFDEIEKAHPDVFNLLLPILEEGELTDSSGRIINFKNNVIIMTSNVGLEAFNQQAMIGFGSTQEKDANKEFAQIKENILQSLTDYFPPEFLNRLDSILVFESLDKKAAEKIIQSSLYNLQAKLKDKQIELNFEKKIITWLLKKENSLKEGARSLKRLVDQNITDQIALKIMQTHPKKIKIKLVKDKIIIN